MRKNSSIQTTDIICDEMIKWNDIKKARNLHFKTIDDADLIEHLMAERNAQHLNQVKGYFFTVEPLATLIRNGNFTSFSEKILKGTANFSILNLTPTIETYLKNLQHN